MSIQTYQTETGELRFQVYVNVRSQNSSIRIQKRSKGFKTETEAKREESKLLREAEREVLGKESLGSSWGNVVDQWERYLMNDRSESVNSITRSDYIASLRNHTERFWKFPASSITKADVRELLNQMEDQGCSVSFRNKMKVIINRVFVYGMESGLIKGIHQSPALGISLGREEQKKPEILTISEIKKLLTEARNLEHKWFYAWALALLTGMRNGELFALTWQDVDFDQKSLSVTKSYNCRK